MFCPNKTFRRKKNRGEKKNSVGKFSVCGFTRGENKIQPGFFFSGRKIFVYILNRNEKIPAEKIRVDARVN